VIEKLLNDLLSGDDGRAEAVVEALFQVKVDELFEIQAQLCTKLASGTLDVDQRWWALRALAEIPFDQSLHCLMQALQDPDPGVRQCAGLGLRKIPHPDAIPALLAALDDPDLLCADLAADTLVEIGPPAKAALLDIAANGSKMARMRAQRALDRSMTPARPTATKLT
jgi:HEAT repeat protein